MLQTFIFIDSMNFFSTLVWIVKILAVFFILESQSRDDGVVEKFYWTPRNDARNVQLEFVVIGNRVPWNIAKVLCSTQDFSGTSDNDSLDSEVTWNFANSTRISKNVEIIPESRLAIVEEDKAKTWLSRLLSESDYRYDGLWIGGHRTNSNGNWTWIGIDGNKEIVIPPSPILGNYPEWYKADNSQDVEKNCLVFDRVGHDLPILVPSDCQQRKPFICSRVVRKKAPERIIEGIDVYADGHHYTVYSVEDGEEAIKELENTSGVRKLNGGGVKWRDARIECRKRGQYFANVRSNKSVTAIASIMLKNRPSMESVWLGAWSPDGTDWTWSPKGFPLSSTKSSTSQYPPWLSGHPVTISNLDEYQQRRGRCLILDRHLCPDHISPVFLDLDCEKKRPFVCQDSLPEQSGIGNRGDPPVSRGITVGNRVLEVSAERMTWNEGRIHCADNFGRIASILDSKTLSAVLEKMTDLYLDHMWVGGRTEKTQEGWRWFDESGKALSRKGIGVGSSWCLGDDEGSWPKAEADNCLNLDREGHGLPLFYGLRCDFAKQHVLCSIDRGSRSLFPPEIDKETKIEENVDNKELKGELAFDGRRSMGPRLKIHGGLDEKEEKGSEVILQEVPENNKFAVKINEETSTLNSNKSSVNSSDDKNSTKFSEDDQNHPKLSTNHSANRKLSKNGTRIADLDEESKRLLKASGYNFTDSDVVLGLELELVDLTENSTIVEMKQKEITELSSILAERIRDLANDERSGILFVLDDSLSVLNAWLAEELKLVAIFLRNLFPLSAEHPMGLLLFSQSSGLALAINQTNDCSVLSHLTGQILGKRGSYSDDKDNNNETVRGSTDLIRAASSAVDIVQTSTLQRVAIMFIADGEHTIASEDNEKEHDAVAEKLKNFRNSGHEAFALVVGQGLQAPGSYSAIQELFGDSANGKPNLYFVKNFSQLGKLVSTINSTTSKTQNDSQCEEPKWIVPKDDELLIHLLQKSVNK